MKSRLFLYTLFTTSKHLRVLSDAGLVEVQPEANRRIYRLRTEPLQEMDKWLDAYRRVWEVWMEESQCQAAKLAQETIMYTDYFSDAEGNIDDSLPSTEMTFK